MAANVGLPPGFTLDEPTLPPGFRIDQQAAPPPPPPGSVQFPVVPSGEQPVPMWQQMFQAATSPQTAGGPMAMAGREGLNTINQAVEKGAYEAGGATTDALAGKVPPEVAAGAGMAANMGVNAVPSLIGAGVGKAVEPITRGAPVIGARDLMQSALKPSSKDLASGDARKAIETMLKGDFAATAGGVAKMRTIVKDLSKDVDKMVAASTGTVDKALLRKEILNELKKFRNQVNPKADVKTILKSWDEFKQTTGGMAPLSVQQAQDMKRGTYKLLADKYAHLGTVGDEAGTQAQMALARGLRKGVEREVPGVLKPNERMTELINAIELAERRAGIAGNRDIGGIAWLAEHPAAAGGMLADRSPWFKSLLAKGLYSGMPGAGALGGAAYTAEEELARRK